MAGGIEFPHGVALLRDRRARADDPYTDGGTQRGAWDQSLTITLAAAFLGPSSGSFQQSEATREQLITATSLYLPNPSADVRPGDRIRLALTPFDPPFGDCPPLFVHVRPSAPTNPFTGWRPVAEIPLELVEG